MASLMSQEGVNLTALGGKNILGNENSHIQISYAINGLGLFEKLPIWPEWAWCQAEKDRISDQRGSGQSDYRGI